MERTRFRGVWMNSASANLHFADGAMTYDNLRVTREEGIGTGSFTYDWGKHEVRLTNVQTTFASGRSDLLGRFEIGETGRALQIPATAEADREWRCPVSRRERDASRDRGRCRRREWIMFFSAKRCPFESVRASCYLRTIDCA